MFGCTENWFSLIFFVDIELFEVLIRGQDIFFFMLLFFRWEGDFVIGFMENFDGFSSLDSGDCI